MRLSSTLVVASLSCVARTAIAASAAAHVYLFDPDSSTPPASSPQSVDPETARLIFAQRLGLAEFHSIKNADAKAIEQLNRFGGRRQQLWGDNGDGESQRSTVVIIEGVERPEDLVPGSAELSTFAIEDPPSSLANAQLLSSFASQAKQLPTEAHNSGIDSIVTKLLLQPSASAISATGGSHNWRTVAHLERLNSIVRSQSTTSASYTNELSTLRTHLSSLLAIAKSEAITLTIALFPPTPHKPSKRSYGLSNLAARSANSQRQSEEPLSAPLPSAASPSKASKNTKIPHALANHTLPAGKPIPTCFASLSACQAGTHNCTGHGACVEQYRYADNACFGCACKPVVVTDTQGRTKTTAYGGAACHKKDVHVPFWLFAGFSVFMVSMVTWGIGLLYTMGGQELPSVIGAGVSGPKAK